VNARIATPEWLLQPQVGLCPCRCSGVRRKTGFVDRTIRGAARALQEALFADDVARHHGFLQRLDARVKLVSALALLTVAALLRHIPVLVGLYAVTVAIALASGLGLALVVRRVWLFVPIFTGIVVLPATLDVVTPGHVLVPLGTWFGTSVGLTTPGLTAAGLIVVRVATSVSFVVLVTLTTPWSKLLGALRTIRVPRTFVLVIGMAYRYLFLLLAVVGDMYLAREARAVVDRRDGRGGRRFVAASAGALFGKTHALSEEVHQAMVARGYRGDVRTLDSTRLDTHDVFAAVTVVVVGVLALGVDRALGS
jgi:cobalt/nickel transport system permease protein